jgi:hypothetical protein
MALTRRGKIGLIAVGLFAFIAVLEESWRPLEKYFPELNRYLHSGTPTTLADWEYFAAHLQSDVKRLDALCMADISSLHDERDVVRFVEDCHAQTLAARPVLDDLHDRSRQFRVAWEKEKTDRSVPTECKSATERVLASLDDYLAAEDEEFALWQSVNPDSATHEEIARTLRRAAELDLGSVASTSKELKGTDEKLITDACRAY